MATSRRAALAAALGPLRNAIRAASVVPRSATPDGKAAPDYVYEFYVLMRYVDSCRPAYGVTYDPGFGTGRDRFPKKPAGKAGRPRFLLWRAGKTVAEICAGTAVQDKHHKDRHPDISLQRAGCGDTPGPNDVIAILDAKYTRTPNKPLAQPDFSQFARFVDLLVGATKISPAVRHPLGGNCLVTNGRFSTEPDAELHARNVDEVAHFHPNAQEKHRP